MIVTSAVVRELLAFATKHGVPHVVVTGQYDYSELRKFGRDHLHMNMDEDSLRQGLLGVIFDKEVRSAFPMSPGPEEESATGHKSVRPARGSPMDRHLLVRNKDGVTLAHVLGHDPDRCLVRPATLYELHAGHPDSCRECLVWSVMND